ncbi:MAG: hypothetical protein M3O34_19090, partial [Chloroflexota bacterium]|nr:hypothetical protein [Chloroflexota bacterium]
MTAPPTPPTAVGEATGTPIPVGLEHRLAFDLAWAALPSGGPMLLIASNLPFLVEGSVRARGPITVLAETAELADAAGRLARAASQDDAVILDPESVGEPPRAGELRGAVWAAPLAESWRARLAAIDGLLSEGSMLTVFAAGPGDRLLARLGRHRTAGSPACGESELAPALAARGYSPMRVIRLGGPANMAWAGLSR